MPEKRKEMPEKRKEMPENRKEMPEKRKEMPETKCLKRDAYRRTTILCLYVVCIVAHG